MCVPGDLCVSKQCVYVVIEGVEEVRWQLEGWAEDYHHVRQSHPVYC